MINIDIKRLGQCSRSKGFTLLELLITMAVLAILAGVALPSFREISMNMTASDSTNSLIAALNTARAEAVKRGRDVAVISASGGWSEGWCVKLDTSSVACAAAGNVDPDEFFSRGPQPTGYSLKAAASPSEMSVVSTKVIFSGTGALAGGATRFDFSVCRPSGAESATKSRWVTIAAGGVISSRRDSSSSPAGACS